MAAPVLSITRPEVAGELTLPLVSPSAELLRLTGTLVTGPESATDERRPVITEPLEVPGPRRTVLLLFS